MVEWGEGSDVVGDFHFAGPRILVRRSLWMHLAEVLGPVSAGTVEMVQESRFDREGARRRQRGKRVLLPYDGPPLVELLPEAVVAPGPATTLEELGSCSVCGAPRRRLAGVEVEMSRYCKRGLVPVNRPRSPGEGVIVDATIDASVFLVWSDDVQLTLFDERAKSRIEGLGATNVRFLEYGTVSRREA